MAHSASKRPSETFVSRNVLDVWGMGKGGYKENWRYGWYGIYDCAQLSKCNSLGSGECSHNLHPLLSEDHPE